MTTPSDPQHSSPLSPVDAEAPVEAATPDGAASGPRPAIPKRIVFTSTAVLVTALLFSVVLMISAMYGWYAIGPSIRSQMSNFQVGTLAFFVLVMVAIMLSLGYSRLWADEDGIVVRNGPVLRRFRVDEVVGVRLRQGDAWGYLLVKQPDGVVRKRAVLAIQQLEGTKAREKRLVLRAWLKANGASSQGVRLDAEGNPVTTEE